MLPLRHYLHFKRSGAGMAHEIEQLRREFYALAQTNPHGMEQQIRHSDIRPEWIMRIVKNPYARRLAQDQTILDGRVPEFNRWIMVVLAGNPEFGFFHAVYADRRLENDYGGRP